MNSYATTEDVIAYKGSLTADAITKLPEIIKACSAELRLIAKRQGKNLDEMMEADEDVAIVVKKGVIDASVNYYNSCENKDPIMSQFSQAAGGYSISGTLLNPGNSFYFPKRFLKDIGLSTQRVGTIEVFDNEFIKRSEGSIV